MRLSESTEAGAWLRQFGRAEGSAARLLLGGIRLVSHAEFEAAIAAQITRVRRLAKGKIALFPVVEPVKDRRGRPIAVPKDFSHATYFQGKSASAKSLTPESAGRVGHYLVNLARLKPREVSAAPSLDAMRAERVRHIVFVDDIVGSGRRITEYWKYVVPRTIKSWLSSHHLQLWMVVYAAHAEGQRQIFETLPRLPKANLLAAIDLPDLRKYWPGLVTELCKDYGQGFGAGMCPIVFQHGCPNNAPSVIWRGPRALFPNRGVPPSLYPCFEDQPSERLSEALWNSNQRSLAVEVLETFRNPLTYSDKLLLSCLGLLARGLNPAKLSSLLLYEKDKLDIALERARRSLLLTHTNRLTELGLEVLASARRSQKRKSQSKRKSVEQSGKEYYPQSFEGERRYLAKSGE